MASTVLASTSLPDENKGPIILGVVASTTVIAFIIVCMRFYVRIHMIRAVGADDYFILAALVCSVASFGVNIPDVAIGAGRHAAYIVPASNIVKGLKLNFVTQPLLLAGTTLTKVSIGFFLLRIAPNQWYRRSLIIVNTFLIVITIFFVITLFVQCKPLAAVWDFSLRSTANCWNSNLLQRLSYANTSINVAVDFGYAALPIPMLWSVQIYKRTKAAIVVIMGLGIFAAISGIMKITTIAVYGRTGDFLFDSTGLTIWTTTELNVGIIAGSVPCLKPLFKAIMERSGYVSNTKVQTKPNHRSYTLQSSGKNTKGLSSQADRGDFQLQTFKAEVGVKVRHRGEFPDDVSEESLLALEGIVKTTQVSVSSDNNSRKSLVDGEGSRNNLAVWNRLDHN